MKPIFRIALVATLALSASMAMAIPFDNSAGGTATAVIASPSGGDYTNLEAASIAFNAVAGGINRPWILEIQDEAGDNIYFQPNNVAFGNTFGAGGSLTIRPAAGATPTIEFTSTATATGWFGHLLIGCTIAGQTGTPDNTNSFSSNGNYIIDGSNDGSGSRDLTLQGGVTNGNLASPMNRLIRICGNSDGVIVRNCNLIFNDTALSNAPIALAGGSVSGVDAVPDNVIIENNLIVNSTGAGNPFGLETTVAATSPGATAGTAIQGLIFRNNDVQIRQRGVFLNGVGSHQIHDNVFTMNGHPSGGFTNAGYFHFTSNSAPGWTAEIYNNDWIIQSQLTAVTAGQGSFGIFIDGGPLDGTYEIYNNVFREISFPNMTSPTDVAVVGIRTGSLDSDYVIEHNSINIGANANVTGATDGNVAAIRTPLALTTGTIAIRNNIIRMAYAGGGTTAAINHWATAAGITSTSNNLVALGNTLVGRVAGVDSANLAAWQTAGYDTVASGGQSVDPFGTSPGSWFADLRFSFLPSQLGTVPASVYLTDIDGDARPATGALPGADENTSLPTAVQAWGSYL